MSAMAIPQHLRCPLRGSLMIDPVIITKPTASLQLGGTYERRSVIDAVKQDAFLPNEPLRAAALDFVLSAAISKVPIDSIKLENVPRAAASLLSRIVADNSISQYHVDARKLACSCSNRSALHEMCKILSRSDNFADHVERTRAMLTRYVFSIKIECVSRPSIAIEIDNHMAVRDVKRVIEKVYDTSQKMHLMFGGIELDDDAQIDACRVGPKSSLQVILKERRSIQKDARDSSQRSQGVQQKGPSGGWSNELFVITPTGKTLSIRCSSGDTIDQIKKQIQDQEGIPADEQQFIFAGKQLQDGCSLADYSIHNKAKIHLVLRLRGGMHHHSTTGANELGETTFDVALAGYKVDYTVGVRAGGTLGELYSAVVLEGVVRLRAFPERFRVVGLDVGGSPRFAADSDHDDGVIPRPGECLLLRVQEAEAH